MGSFKAANGLRLDRRIFGDRPESLAFPTGLGCYSQEINRDRATKLELTLYTCRE